MLLTFTVFLPLAGALALLTLPRDRDRAARWLAVAFSLATFGLAVALAVRFEVGQDGFQLGVTADWVRSLGVRFRLGVDGVSLPLVLLTTVLAPLAVTGSWRMSDRPRTYLALLLVLETAMLGVFVSLDLFLFYIFWEAVLVPSYFLVGSWGGPRRIYAAVKFFIYTLLGGLLMLVGIVGLAYLHAKATGSPSFDYEALRDLGKNPVTQRWLFLAFFAAFAIKTPLVPLHSWLPDAYVQAPTTTTVLLAGVMSKMGVYGFLRFSLPLFPDAAHWFQPLLLTLAVAGILYCAVVAAGQRDFKRLVAYSSVSHLGFIVLGIFAFNVQGLQGGVFYMVAAGAARHLGDRRVRRHAAVDAAHGRRHAGDHARRRGPPGPGRLRGRVPHPHRRVPGQPRLRGPRRRRGDPGCRNSPTKPTRPGRATAASVITSMTPAMRGIDRCMPPNAAISEVPRRSSTPPTPAP